MELAIKKPVPDFCAMWKRVRRMLAAAHPYEQSQDKKLLVRAIERAKRAIVAEQHEQQEFAREMGVTV